MSHPHLHARWLNKTLDECRATQWSGLRGVGVRLLDDRRELVGVLDVTLDEWRMDAQAREALLLERIAHVDG